MPPQTTCLITETSREIFQMHLLSSQEGAIKVLRTKTREEWQTKTSRQKIYLIEEIYRSTNQFRLLVHICKVKVSLLVTIREDSLNAKSIDRKTPTQDTSSRERVSLLWIAAGKISKKLRMLKLPNMESIWAHSQTGTCWRENHRWFMSLSKNIPRKMNHPKYLNKFKIFKFPIFLPCHITGALPRGRSLKEQKIVKKTTMSD